MTTGTLELALVLPHYTAQFSLLVAWIAFVSVCAACWTCAQWRTRMLCWSWLFPHWTTAETAWPESSSPRSSLLLLMWDSYFVRYTHAHNYKTVSVVSISFLVLRGLVWKLGFTWLFYSEKQCNNNKTSYCIALSYNTESHDFRQWAFFFFFLLQWDRLDTEYIVFHHNSQNKRENGGQGVKKKRRQRHLLKINRQYI